MLGYLSEACSLNMVFGTEAMKNLRMGDDSITEEQAIQVTTRLVDFRPPKTQDVISCPKSGKYGSFSSGNPELSVVGKTLETTHTHTDLIKTKSNSNSIGALSPSTWKP